MIYAVVPYEVHRFTLSFYVFFISPSAYMQPVNVVPDVMDRRDDELVKKDDPRRSRRREFCEGQDRQPMLSGGRGGQLPLPAEAKNWQIHSRGRVGTRLYSTALYGHLIVKMPRPMRLRFP